MNKSLPRILAAAPGGNQSSSKASDLELQVLPPSWFNGKDTRAKIENDSQNCNVLAPLRFLTHPNARALADTQNQVISVAVLPQPG